MTNMKRTGPLPDSQRPNREKWTPPTTPHDDKVEAVALWLIDFKNKAGSSNCRTDCYYPEANTLLELALGDIRTIAMRALEDDRDHRNELRSIIHLCPPAPPVKIEWNEASERGFDAKHEPKEKILSKLHGVCKGRGVDRRELVKNVLNNEEDVTKATDQIMQIFKEGEPE